MAVKGGVAAARWDFLVKKRGNRMAHIFEKGHPGYFKGKPIDGDAFIAAYADWRHRKINKFVLADRCGISLPTLNKRLHMLWENGYIPAYLFTDNKPMIQDGYYGPFNKYGEDDEK